MSSDLERASPGAPPAGTASRGPVPAGTTFGGRFKVSGFLRKEGVSDVYRALDTTADAPAALRLLALSALGPGAAQLQADVNHASALQHKNLVLVLGVGHQGDHIFVATELVDGQSLRELIDAKRAEGRAVTPKGAYNVVAHIANALTELHKVTVHGGLNPANIWVNKAGRVKVGDVGLTRAISLLDRRGGQPGTADTLYTAPEVLAGTAPGPASDVYALGAILYELLTSRAPAPPLTPPSQTSADIAPAMDAVIARALKKAPEARWASVSALKDALAEAMAGPAVATAAPTAPAAAPARAQAAPRAAIPPGASAELAIEMSSRPGPPGGDDGQERWLIQKDKLDFGPFSMTQVRTQIDRGEIIADHVIVDMDSGARKKIKDHAQLKELAKLAERKFEQMRRARAEQVSEKTEKKKSAVTVVVIGAAALLVAGGITLYVASRQGSVDEKLASRVGEADVDEFLKNVKLDFAAVSVVKRGAGRRSGGSAAAGAGAQGADEFNNDQILGDVTAGGGGDETLSDDAIQRVMIGNYRSLVPCIMDERRRSAGLSNINLEFVVRGSGKVSAVRANGQRGGPFASCLLGRMQSFAFPKFNGAKTIAGWSMSMR